MSKRMPMFVCVDVADTLVPETAITEISNANGRIDEIKQILNEFCLQKPKSCTFNLHSYFKKAICSYKMKKGVYNFIRRIITEIRSGHFSGEEYSANRITANRRNIINFNIVFNNKERDKYKKSKINSFDYNYHPLLLQHKLAI